MGLDHLGGLTIATNPALLGVKSETLCRAACATWVCGRLHRTRLQRGFHRCAGLESEQAPGFAIQFVKECMGSWCMGVFQLLDGQRQ